MYNVLTLNKIAAVGTDQLDPKKYTHATEIENPDAVLVRSADMHDFDLSGKLKCIARAGAGTNNIPIDKCSEKGIVVFNTPGANANAVKELVLCSLFLSSRDIAGGLAWAQTLQGEGDQVGKLVEKGKSAFAGPEIMGKTLGIVGLGAIGVMVANAALELGMDVLGFDPYISVDAAWGLSQKVRRARDLKHIYAESDYISIHVPLNNETRGMFNADVFATVKPGLRLINAARADLVVSKDLLAALEDGKVASYVTDFPNADMLGHKKIVAIPHLGASTPESEDNCARMAVSEMADFLEYGHIKNSVNFPDIALEVGQGGTRLCVTHRNSQGVIGQIAEKVGAHGINIENMVNKSKKELACSLFDLAGKPDDALADELKKMPDVLGVRIIL